MAATRSPHLFHQARVIGDLDGDLGQVVDLYFSSDEFVKDLFQLFPAEQHIVRQKNIEAVFIGDAVFL